MAYDIESALQRALAQTSEPSKRSIRNKSGRAGRRQAQSRSVLRAVGGVAGNYVDGTYSDKVEMCVVVDREIKAVREFTAPLYTAPTGQLLGRVGCV